MRSSSTGVPSQPAAAGAGPTPTLPPAAAPPTAAAAAAAAVAAGRVSLSDPSTFFRRLGIAAVFPPTAPDTSKDQRANGLAFSESGRIIASSHNDGVINLLSGETGARDAELHVREGGCRLITPTHHEAAWLHAANPPLGHPCFVAYHDVHENKIVRHFKGHTNRVTSLSISPLGDTFLSCGLDGKFVVWDVRAPNPAAVGTFAPAEPPTSFQQGGEPPAATGSFDTSGKIFAIAVPQRGIGLYNTTKIGSEKLEEFLPTRTAFATAKFPMLQYTTNPVYLPGMNPAETVLPPPFPSSLGFVDMRFSPNENLLAVVTSDRGVLILNAWEISQELALLNSHPHDILHPSTVSWTPDGNFLCVGGADGHVWAYDLRNPPPVPKPGGGVAAAAGDAGEAPPFAWRPGFWDPPMFLVGEAHKVGGDPLGGGGGGGGGGEGETTGVSAAGEAARKAAWEGAKKHREGLFEKMHKFRKDFAASRNIPVDNLGPPKTVPSQAAPLATTPEEQRSRHEAPVLHVRWHPSRAVMASAARNVAVWGLAPEGGSGGGGKE